jgi:hypothetical protein
MTGQETVRVRRAPRASIAIGSGARMPNQAARFMVGTASGRSETEARP